MTISSSLNAGIAALVVNGTKLGAIADNIATRKLYVTGMTGALYDGASPDGVPHTQHRFIRPVHQAYGRNYQLPNLTAYNETCATIGYAMWLWRMLAVTGEARFADDAPDAPGTLHAALVLSTVAHGHLVALNLDAARAMEPFYRADPSRSKVGGLGLGLTLAQRVAQAHGGSLELESAVGRGTRVRLLLPGT